MDAREWLDGEREIRALKSQFSITELPATLGATLTEAARVRSDAPFILHGEEVTSYRELNETSHRAAAGLARLGLEPGDRIGLLSLNRIEWLILFFAAARIGVAVVAMSPRYRETELAYMVRDSDVKAVVTIAEHEGYNFQEIFSRLASELPSLQHLILLSAAIDDVVDANHSLLQRISYFSLLDSETDDSQVESSTAQVTPDDLAMVIYTSGTTGRPKGAGLTHRSMLTSARAQAAHMRINEYDLLPLANPLNHVGGIVCGFLAVMVGGGRVDLVPEFKALDVLERIRRHRPTLLAGVPTMMVLLLMKWQDLDIDSNSIRLLYAGGSNVDPALLVQLEQRMPQAILMNLYGLSEASGAIAMTPLDVARDDLMGSVGKPIGDAQVRVVDAISGQPLPFGQTGELCFRGCGVVPGYIGAARESGTFGEDGWMRTGDLGEVDARGFITLKGRVKDMYIQGGFNVYPAEVEACIARHAEVMMVAGIGVPDKVLGEIGRYYVVRKPGSAVTEDALRAWCKQDLADYKVPRQIEFRDSLPLTPAGKVHKAILRDKL